MLVLVRDTAWSSLNGRWFAISAIVSLIASQIELAGSDTSGETEFVGNTGTVAIAETRTYVPPGG